VFRIGEFSHIARVTTKLLRFYDRLGLLTPAHVDPATGYRFYTADQLPRLNRILALKELGFSLDEITDLVEAEVPATEPYGTSSPPSTSSSDASWTWTCSGCA
jgi:DNA-binding transcriptional MerR regulator